MHINKDRFTTIALGCVEVHQKYDKDDVILDVASKMATELHEELGWDSLSLASHNKLKEAFKQAAGNSIDWTRINRKVEPEEYADAHWREYWDSEESSQRYY